MSTLRSTAQRAAAVRATLEKQTDRWLATADGKGRPHLIAVSCWWNGGRLTIATVRRSRTADNLASTRLARIGIGSPDDVIMIDASVMGSEGVKEASPEVGDGFAVAVGWDPREISDEWSFFHLRPSRIQAYKGYDEIPGRDVMRDGKWLD